MYKLFKKKLKAKKDKSIALEDVELEKIDRGDKIEFKIKNLLKI